MFVDLNFVLICSSESRFEQASGGLYSRLRLCAASLKLDTKFRNTLITFLFRSLCKRCTFEFINCSTHESPAGHVLEASAVPMHSPRMIPVAVEPFAGDLKSETFGDRELSVGEPPTLSDPNVDRAVPK